MMRVLLRTAMLAKGAHSEPEGRPDEGTTVWPDPLAGPLDGDGWGSA